jgi:hypothetical protein
MEVTGEAPFAATAPFSQLRRVGKIGAAQRRRESLAHNFAQASMHIQRVGAGAPDFELAVRASLRRLLTLLRRRLPKIRYIRCISTTPFRKMMTRSFLALREAAVSGQSSHRVPAVRRALG